MLARTPLSIFRFFKTESHDAEAETLALKDRPREKALALLGRLSQLSKAQFRIK